MTDPNDTSTAELNLNMVAIPANTATQADLEQWFMLADQLKKIKAEEMVLRQRIFDTYFPAPMEGTNTATLPDGFALKGKYTVNREVDIAAFTANRAYFQETGIPMDSMVQFKPSLVLSAYRTLTAEQAQLFDQCLIVKPGSPALEIVQPKKAAKAGETK